MRYFKTLFLFCAVFFFFIPSVQAEDQEHHFRHDGYKRTYLVHTPPNYSKERQWPVILNFHGGGGNIEASVRGTNMNETADKHGFIVVYPEGTGKWKFHVWNAGHCCGSAAEDQDNVDDVGFVDELIDRLIKDYNVDPKRVYATGLSNGAQMSYRLACRLSERIAAIAPIGSQSLQKDCRPSRAVPVLHFHGTEDICAKYYGGEECGGCFADFFHALGIPMKKKTWPCISVPASMKPFAEIGGCSDETVTTYQRGDVTCESYKGCKKGANVTLCTVEGGGHTWPGGSAKIKACDRKPDGRMCKLWMEGIGEVTQDIDANEAMWNFFQRYSL